MIFLKKIVLSIFFGSLSFLGLSQSIQVSELNKDWKLIGEENGIEIHAKSQSCKVEGADKNFDYIFFKLTNNTSEKKAIEFYFAKHFSDNTCAGCDQRNESFRSLEIAPNTSVKDDCINYENSLHVLLQNPYALTKGFNLKSVELLNLSVK